MNRYNNIKKTMTITPLLLIIGIMPLICYGKIDVLTENVFLNWSGKTSEIDFFSYYRMIFTVMMTILCLIIFIINKLKVKKDISVYKYMIVYVLCIIISVLFSEYKDIAIRGFVFRYEGMIALISYMFILFFAINMIDDIYKLKNIIFVLTISSIIVGIVGLLQYLGYDIFQNTEIQKLIIPKEHHYLVGNLKFFTTDNTKVYSTLSNSNYVGSYFSLILPILIGLSLLVRKKKIIFIIASIINMIVLIISDSATGLISVLISCIVLIFIARENILKNYKKECLLIVCTILGILVIDFCSTKVIYTKFKNIVSEIIYEVNVGKEKSKLEDVLLGGNTAQIEYKNKLIKIESYNDELIFKDEKGNDLLVEFNKENNTWSFKNKEYEDVNVEFVSLSDRDIKFIKFRIDDDIIINLTTENDEFKYITHAGRIIDNKDIKYWGKDGLEELLTSRYYIWSRILPYIFEKPLVGYGPDTFAAVFPQFDYVGMYKAYDRTNMIVDKAHNMYIQIAENTGIISLIAFIGIIYIYISTSIKVYVKSKFEDIKSILGICIFIGIIGYLISGLFNDSVVFIAPIFYILLGIGIRLNKEIHIKY